MTTHIIIGDVYRLPGPVATVIAKVAFIEQDGAGTLSYHLTVDGDQWLVMSADEIEAAASYRVGGPRA